MDRKVIPYRQLPLMAALLGTAVQATPAQLQQAGGHRYKFQGSSIAVLTSYQGESPTKAITAATNTNPATITVTSHGRSLGDVIEIASVGGMTELNGTSYIISAVPDANTLTLLNTDATGYGTYTSGGYIQAGLFSNFCELTAYDRTGATSPTIPATTICSTAEEYEVGLRGSGTTKLSYNFAPQTTIQLAVAAFDASKALTAVKILLPNSGGGRVQLGFVQQLSEKSAVGGLWTADVAFLNTGPFFDFTN